MAQEDNLIKFPHADTPMWDYMQKYYRVFREQGEKEGDAYLASSVPGPLQGRVKVTVLRMIQPANKDT